MPKITKEFSHVDIDTTCGAMYPIKTRTSDAMDVMYTHKGATDNFYADFKELLAQCTELEPAFNDEEKSFTIFDAKFYIRCLNTVKAPYYNTANVEYCVRPFLFKEGFEYRNPPKEVIYTWVGGSEMTYASLNCSRDNNSNYNQVHYNDYFVQGTMRNFNGAIFFYHSCYSDNMTGGKIPANYDNAPQYYYDVASNSNCYYGYTYPGTQYARFGYDSSATIVPYDNLACARYTIEIYYNTNWIQVLYISPKGEKFSLGLFYVGQFTNPNTQETEDMLFTQQDGGYLTGLHSIFGHNVYMSNWLHGGYAKNVYRYRESNVYTNYVTTEKLKYTGNRLNGTGESSDYYSGPITWQQLMFFKKGHLANVLEELGTQNVFHATSSNAVMNSYVSNDPTKNDFQLYNLGLNSIWLPIQQQNFGYLVPLNKKFFKTPLTLLNGMVKFENIIYGQAQPTSGFPLYQFFDSDMVYDIDDESYYCPFSAYRNYYSYNHSVGILLKL